MRLEKEVLENRVDDFLQNHRVTGTNERTDVAKDTAWGQVWKIAAKSSMLAILAKFIRRTVENEYKSSSQVNDKPR